MSSFVRTVRQGLSALHLAAAILLLLLVSWGLLSVNPLKVVNGTSFRFLRLVNDLILHLTIYTTLTAVLLPLVKTHRVSVQRFVTVLIALHAVATELLQLWIPRRTCDPLDLAANWTGILLGIQLISRWPRIAAGLVTLITGSKTRPGTVAVAGDRS